jgi:hypothetical protein
MIEVCKFCEAKIPVPDLGEDWSCTSCNKYSIVCIESGFAETENLRIGNYWLVFLPAYKEASVVEQVDGIKHKRINSIPMDELTHELAVQWVKKLKTYVIFQ